MIYLDNIILLNANKKLDTEKTWSFLKCPLLSERSPSRKLVQCVIPTLYKSFWEEDKLNWDLGRHTIDYIL